MPNGSRGRRRRTARRSSCFIMPRGRTVPTRMPGPQRVVRPLKSSGRPPAFQSDGANAKTGSERSSTCWKPPPFHARWRHRCLQRPNLQRQLGYNNRWRAHDFGVRREVQNAQCPRRRPTSYTEVNRPTQFAQTFQSPRLLSSRHPGSIRSFQSICQPSASHEYPRSCSDQLSEMEFDHALKSSSSV